DSSLRRPTPTGSRDSVAGLGVVPDDPRRPPGLGPGLNLPPRAQKAKTRAVAEGLLTRWVTIYRDRLPRHRVEERREACTRHVAGTGIITRARTYRSGAGTARSGRDGSDPLRGQAEGPGGAMSAPRYWPYWRRSPCTATTSSRSSSPEAAAPGAPARARSTPRSRCWRTVDW